MDRRSRPRGRIGASHKLQSRVADRPVPSLCRFRLDLFGLPSARNCFRPSFSVLGDRRLLDVAEPADDLRQRRKLCGLLRVLRRDALQISLYKGEILVPQRTFETSFGGVAKWVERRLTQSLHPSKKSEYGEDPGAEGALADDPGRGVRSADDGWSEVHLESVVPLELPLQCRAERTIDIKAGDFVLVLYAMRRNAECATARTSRRSGSPSMASTDETVRL